MESPRKIGIMGGSYDPVHSAHLMVADYVRQRAGLDAVWLTLSPQNPLKDTHSGAADDHRMAMLRMACHNSVALHADDVELSLPVPSYTINTLRHLQRQYPECDFTLIIGSDNWQVFDQWRQSADIIREFGVIVYPRPGFPVADAENLPEGVTLVEAPYIEVSSTFVRQCISEGLDMTSFLPAGVFDYIRRHRLYTK